MNSKQRKELLDLSRHYGSDPDFLLAGGGNSSFKGNTRLYIKASGRSLSDITAEGFVCLNRAKLAALWDRRYPQDPKSREAQVLEDLLAAREPGQQGKRPSVETLLHDLIEAPYVMHTHPFLVNALTCSRQGKKAAAELLGNSALWIPTVNPGYILASTTRAALAKHRAKHGREPGILLFENHGLCVAGGSFREIRELTDRLMRTIAKRIRQTLDLTPAAYDRRRAAEIAPALRMLLWKDSSVLVFHTNRALLPFLKSRTTFARVSTSITPDHIVYCSHETLFIAKRSSLEEQFRQLEGAIAAYREEHGQPPVIIAVQELGVFAWGSSRRNADIALAVFLDAVKVVLHSEAFGGARTLPQEQVRFIRNWEAEAFRRRVAQHHGGPGSSSVRGRIAVVTGAAQGFGAGIAEGLLEHGAEVVIADLNAGLARERAAELERRFGPGRCRAVAADVRREDSVAAMIQETVLEYGGLDLLVSNAGVLKAGSLEELDAESFEFVTSVNYRGFYLCTREAARVMKLQHRFAPDHRTDIVQINSKSGLSGSNRNFAYAGSKFGGIGLMQSFALELVDHNIKVNAICPGNFFDGPLWSDPRRGLFVQYLRADKVPGARTVADVRRFYEQKVPMKRGCRVQDVIKALLYIVDQDYETGQAVPVTGGQIMLH